MGISHVSGASRTAPAYRRLSTAHSLLESTADWREESLSPPAPKSLCAGFLPYWVMPYYIAAAWGSISAYRMPTALLLLLQQGLDPLAPLHRMPNTTCRAQAVPPVEA